MSTMTNGTQTSTILRPERLKARIFLLALSFQGAFVFFKTQSVIRACLDFEFLEEWFLFGF
ncbi:hypothetical protein ST45_12030 [Prevotella pectinovora]|nr:hypothetical protein ST45_12030 [Prevotella pectinovora]